MGGNVYDGERKSSPGKTAIEKGSKEEQLVADYRERGLSLYETMILINKWCRKNGRELVTRSAVYSCEKRLDPKRSKTGKRPQGSLDENSKWAQCRFRWVAQLLIRLGHVDKVDLNEFLDEETKELPDCFDADMMEKISLAAIAWWDEVHKDCFIGDFREGSSTQLRFKRNEKGELDEENGEYREETLELQVKYAKQVRFSFGVALREEDGKEVGVRLKPFNYTGRNILTKTKHQVRINAEIRRVKKLDREHKDWVSKHRDENALYHDDPVDKVKSIGDVTRGLLHDNDILLVSDLLALKDDKKAIKTIVDRTKGLGEKGLVGFIEYCHANLVEGEDAPEIEYYLDAANPYAAKYGRELNEWGEEKWLDEIKKHSSFSDVCCITDLVKHIVVETKECYANTEFKDTYFFYHDALSQLTHAACVDWMKKTKVPGETKCIYDRWIKPELGLNDKFGKTWWRRPVGNSPELMPLDNSLNQDIHMSVRRHIACCLGINLDTDNDERMFSSSTPKELQSAYLRVTDPAEGVAPTSDRIVQDIKKVVDSMIVIYNKKGVFVPGLAGGRTAGGRWTETAEKTSNNHGGKRVKGAGEELKEDQMHHDLLALIEESGDITEHFQKKAP